MQKRNNITRTILFSLLISLVLSCSDKNDTDSSQNYDSGVKSIYSELDTVFSVTNDSIVYYGYKQDLYDTVIRSCDRAQLIELLSMTNGLLHLYIAKDLIEGGISYETLMECDLKLCDTSCFMIQTSVDMYEAWTCQAILANIISSNFDDLSDQNIAYFDSIIYRTPRCMDISLHSLGK